MMVDYGCLQKRSALDRLLFLLLALLFALLAIVSLVCGLLYFRRAQALSFEISTGLAFLLLGWTSIVFFCLFHEKALSLAYFQRMGQGPFSQKTGKLVSLHEITLRKGMRVLELTFEDGSRFYWSLRQGDYPFKTGMTYQIRFVGQDVAGVEQA